MEGAISIARPFRDIYTITRLNREARAILEDGFPPLWVEGEISNLARPASGHLYFSLKDAQCQVRCALFRSRNTGFSFDPVNGIQVLARAQVSPYEGAGRLPAHRRAPGARRRGTPATGTRSAETAAPSRGPVP